MQRALLRWFLLSIVVIGCNGSKTEGEAVKHGLNEYEIAEPPVSNEKKVSKLHIVEIMGMKFIPDSLHVNEGDTVIWINKDIVEHDITEQGSKSWTSSRMAPGSSWKMAVTRSEDYYCSLHVVMKGKIIVDGREVAVLNL